MDDSSQSNGLVAVTAPAMDDSSQSSGLVAFKVSIIGACWISASIVFVLNQKRVVAPVDGAPPIFPYVCFWNGIANMCVAFWAILSAQILRLVQGTRTHQTGFRLQEMCILCLIGCEQAVEVTLGTKSLEYLSVAEQGLVTPCVLVIQMLLAVLWRLETTTCIKWVAAGVIVSGTVFENLPCSPTAPAAIAFVCGLHPTTHTGDKEGQLIGFMLLIALGSLMSIRRAVTQHIFQRSHPESAFKQRTKLQMLPFVLVGTVVTSFLLAGILEPQAFEKITEIHVLESIALPALVIPLCMMIIIIGELLIVGITTATIMAVFEVIKTILSVLAGVLFQTDRVFRNQWIGLGICSVGSAMYFYARSRDEIQPKSFTHDADSQDVSAGSIILTKSMGQDMPSQA